MEKNTVRIQNVTLGAGIPKVCVPVMGKDLREWTEAATAAREQADLIELRLDSVSPELDADRVRQACRVVREKAQRSALLATMRTSRDGGAGDGDAERYEKALALSPRPRFTDPVNAIAQLYEIQGQYEKAVEFYQKEIEIVRQDWNETQGEAIDEPLRNIARLKEKMIE